MNTSSPQHIFGMHFIHLFMLFAFMLSCNLSTICAHRLSGRELVVDDGGVFQATLPYWIEKRSFLVDGRLGKRFEDRIEPELEKRSYLVHGRLG
ncbi:hypothetical protein EG68_09607 [Paragonimus skrjabini miyazakii]|uniref:Uncharacterized protein n=1 Tax=Paragonimus skrjabini miyazakii TaxID=59628 RepID=A0A8S9YHK8_9TREM|nr:hypothetical protein EG68_09607 [Paragonimus skrjabini miyazakii]